MSTKIKSIYTERTVVISRAVLGHINVALPVGPDVNVSHSDLIAAVETECHVRLVPADAIVIDRADLAPVSIVDGRAVADGASDPYSASLVANPNWAWQYALNAIAVSEYLRAHLPVDEADVETLAGLIRQHNHGAFTSDVARRLLATGKVTVTK